MLHPVLIAGWPCEDHAWLDSMPGLMQPPAATMFTLHSHTISAEGIEYTSDDVSYIRRTLFLLHFL